MVHHVVLRCAAASVLCAWACSIAAAQTPPGGREAPLITHRRTAAEERIYAALEEQAEGDFSNTPLEDVVDYFKNRHQIAVRIDVKALAEEAVDSSAPVRRSVRGVKLKSALRAILHDLSLTYIVRDELLTITTKSEADNTLEIRTYPVDDLLDGPRDSPDFASMINMITSTINPTTWDENGGPGAIQPYYRGRALVVSQTFEVHEEIDELFDQLRRLGPRNAGARRAYRSRSDRQAEPERRYVADPQLTRIVGQLYPTGVGTAK